MPVSFADQFKDIDWAQIRRDFDASLARHLGIGMTIQITSKHFCAAVELDGTERVCKTAPMLRYMIGWTRKRVLDYARIRKWEAEIAP